MVRNNNLKDVQGSKDVHKYKASKKEEDINAWANDLKQNEKTANKYKGVKTLEDILEVARKDGYNFTEKELLDFDLDTVAGGLDFDLDFDFGDKTSTSTTTTTVQQSQTTTIQNANVNGNNNCISYQSSTDVKQ